MKDSFVQSLDFNTAGRVTDYSTSGLVETWKVGLTSQVNEDVRLRTTWSYDIRAPNLQELYSVGFAILGNAVDPNTGQAVSIYNISAGNPNLDPEKAITISVSMARSRLWDPPMSSRSARPGFRRIARFSVSTGPTVRCRRSSMRRSTPTRNRPPGLISRPTTRRILCPVPYICG